MRNEQATRRFLLVLACVLLAPMAAFAQAPADPAPTAPAPAAGAPTAPAPAADAPAEKPKGDEDWGDEKKGPSYEIHAFVESATSSRVVDDPTTEAQLLLGEARFRLEARHDGDRSSLSFKGDLLADGVSGDVSVDIREALLSFRLGRFIDIKAGRQILTWGTGDLLFLNDLFPKDWISFMTGRSDEYLKAPGTALMIGLYTSAINLDVVWTPIFEPDRFITGERLSFFNPMANSLVGGGPMVVPAGIDRKLKNGEFHGRLHRTIMGYEVALYGYYGFYKQPLAVEVDDPIAPTVFTPSHARLGVYGLSLRGALLGGVINLEGAFHHSIDDKKGEDWTIPNHQMRGLLGYEHELVQKMTLGLQYYLEYTMQHAELMDNSPNPDIEPDELRHVITLRWMYRVLREDLTLGFFAFFSPNDKDFFLRPTIEYKLNDSLKLALGGNIFWGDKEHTFFGQLQKNTNVYLRARYTF